jgi:glucose/arabinose dehydrogenase
MPRLSRSVRLNLELLEDRLAPASNLPPGFIDSPYASGLTNPTAMEFAPDGRLFVLEQAGTAQVWQGQIRVSANFFAGTGLNPSTVDSTGERGLLGIAFDPGYLSNHFLYVYYTVGGANAHNRVSRFTADAGGTQAVIGGEQVMLDLDPLTATNHNGGAIHFGLDGKLYIAVGDGGNTPNKAQDLGSLFGKVLRIDVHAANIIPSDNPFVGVAGARGEIWALGLRNPFTFAVDPTTGQIFVNDVGQSSWEEIDVLARGANYGWPATEGNFNPASFPNFTNPLYAYSHPGLVPGAMVTGYAITGGAFYHPGTTVFPADYTGDYFFADYGSSWIRRIDPGTGVVTDFATDAGNPVDLHVLDGSLYYLARGQGTVNHITYANPGPPLPDGTYGTPAQRYVASLYRDLLHRGLTLTEMQNGSFAGWVNFINAGGSLVQLVVSFEASAEAPTAALNDLYQRYLHRPIEPGGRDGWLNFLAAGGTFEQIEVAIVSSPEFVADHQGDSSAILSDIYQTALGRPIGSSELAGYLAVLNHPATLQQIATGVMISPEHHHFEVRGWYERFLGRTPTEDISGWVGLLGQKRDEQVLADILGDLVGREYYDRAIL